MENIIILVNLVILIMLYWYFNINCSSKCIIINTHCDDIRCVVN
jgi:hypothetical protein